MTITHIIKSELEFVLVGSIRGKEKVIAQSEGLDIKLIGLANKLYEKGFDSEDKKLTKTLRYLKINHIWSDELPLGNNKKYVRLLFCWDSLGLLLHHEDKAFLSQEFNKFIKNAPSLDYEFKEPKTDFEQSFMDSLEEQLQIAKDNFNWAISPFLVECMSFTDFEHGNKTIYHEIAFNGKIDFIYRQLDQLNILCSRYNFIVYKNNTTTRISGSEGCVAIFESILNDKSIPGEVYSNREMNKLSILGVIDAYNQTIILIDKMLINSTLSNHEQILIEEIFWVHYRPFYEKSKLVFSLSKKKFETDDIFIGLKVFLETTSRMASANMNR